MWRAATAASLVALAACDPVFADTVVRVQVDLTAANARTPDRVRVDDRTRIVVHVRKNVFHACTVTSKVDALPAPPNPVALILGILGGIPGVPTALRRDAEATVPAATRGSEPLRRQLDDLLRAVNDLNEDLDAQIVQIRDRATSLPRWVACDGTGICSDPDAARAKLDQLAAAIERTPSHPIASIAVAAARAGELTKALNARLDDPSEDEGAWLRWAFARLRAIEELIDAANERRQLATRARDALLAVRERILAHSVSTSIEEPLPAHDSATASITVACTNIVTQQPAIYSLDGNDRLVANRVAPVSATIIYQTPPRASLSAGLLYSLVDRRNVSIAPHRIGIDDGVATYQRRIVESDHSAFQVVPFSFLNLVAPGFRGRRAALAASLGVGLNPNNGSTVAEYFAGGSLALGRAVTVQVGAHVGSRLEPAEEFAVGDVLPDRLSSVPTVRTRATALAVGLSYALPLPR